eukprot:TRINITY_DN29987_c0_g1_i1.p2 TRINITY_DN29987_c0_g1~~TRINITY_DN29987_c0_g1_i1.p2  ORF type:complete len:125 (+),score=39.60 TRINITY_DN29987_c0_g1_i1:86-460(+)
MASTVDDLIAGTKHLSQIMYERLDALQREAAAWGAEQRAEVVERAAGDVAGLVAQCADLIDALPDEDCYRPGDPALADHLASLQAAHDAAAAELVEETDLTRAYRDSLHQQLVASVQSDTTASQ